MKQTSNKVRIKEANKQKKIGKEDSDLRKKDRNIFFNLNNMI
jgi:hypothetical protein